MTGDLITPTGVLVYDGPPATPEWFAARREGITSTDLPRILGLSKYGNALSVWSEKRNEGPDDEAQEAAHWGNILEEPVAQEWARRHGTTVEPVGVIANAADGWIRASLDRLVRYCPDTRDDGVLCGLEVKTRSAYKAADYRDDIPDDVLAQVQWAMTASGFDHLHVAVLIGGQRLRAFRVDSDPILAGYLREAGERVWEAVLDGVPPEVHPDADGVLLAQLDAMYRDRAGDVELGPEAADLIAGYREGSAMEATGKHLKTETKTALVQMLGPGSTGLVGGEIAFTYAAPEPGVQVTVDALRHLQQTNPELFDALREDGLITETAPGPRFNLKRRRQ